MNGTEKKRQKAKPARAHGGETPARERRGGEAARDGGGAEIYGVRGDPRRQRSGPGPALPDPPPPAPVTDQRVGLWDATVPARTRIHLTSSDCISYEYHTPPSRVGLFIFPACDNQSKSERSRLDAEIRKYRRSVPAEMR